MFGEFVCGCLGGCRRAGMRLKHHYLSEYGFSLQMVLATQFTEKVGHGTSTEAVPLQCHAQPRMPLIASLCTQLCVHW